MPVGAVKEFLGVGRRDGLLGCLEFGLGSLGAFRQVNWWSKGIDRRYI